ncbi:flagella basal body P-ring formation protein FlgA [Allosphingosinicella vermicomposti]|uniref:flagella basal body P-ring formation protein FlgA n=1 Tax=Allosphingosinicella vermicomposti TaxID=614671 RepID=UPI001FE17AD8|nr:flagella basal body P-ring formation protein FlgA [Allosphingosinicella vermicomposti]
MTLFRRLILLSALGAAPAAAQGFQDLDALEVRVTSALGADIGQPGGPSGPIDRRLKLAACPQPVSVEAPALGAATVRCEALGWRIRIPVVASGATVRAAKAEPIIRKGDQVEVVAAGSAFTVSTLAVAEQDGAPGDRIRVRSERKAGPIIGEVSIDGRILLPGFK